MNVDPEAVAAAITPQTKGILPVHLFGQIADMAPLQTLARKHQLHIIEDASQAHGATYFDQRAGSFGIAGCFSLYPTKNLGAIGDAGIITTNSAAMKKKLQSLRNYGMSKKYVCEEEGSNERLDTLQAAFLRVKLPYLDRWNDLRRQHAARYNHLLGDLPLQTPIETHGAKHVYYVYVIRTVWRDSLQRYLQERGIVTGIHYPIPIHKQPAFANEPWAQASFKVTETLAEEILSIPMFPHLKPAQIETVAGTIREFFEEQSQ
jgi:dTDP-4-amino-4,6-dideoxygalactose transaminase